MSTTIFPNKSVRELKKYVANFNQIAGIRRSVLDEGKSKGVRIADVNNGSGLEFTVILDRGMDIGETRFKGIPLAWLSPNGICRPDMYEPESIGWLRTWQGGLLTGCGLRNVGVPSELGEEQFGLHGRLSHIPAENIHCETKFTDKGEYILSVSGSVRESRMFGENILLKRTISATMGENVITIEDTVINEGCRPAEIMLLYHINIGYPMLCENSYLEGKEHTVTPRDDRAAEGINSWNKYNPPEQGFIEQVYYHDIPAGEDGLASIALINPDINLKLALSYRKEELPHLIQWKQTGIKEYVTGLEPANCHVAGIAAEKEAGSIKILNPDESFNTYLKLGISYYNG